MSTNAGPGWPYGQPPETTFQPYGPMASYPPPGQQPGPGQYAQQQQTMPAAYSQATQVPGGFSTNGAAAPPRRNPLLIVATVLLFVAAGSKVWSMIVHLQNLDIPGVPPPEASDWVVLVIVVGFRILAGAMGIAFGANPAKGSLLFRLGIALVVVEVIILGLYVFYGTLQPLVVVLALPSVVFLLGARQLMAPGRDQAGFVIISRG